MIKHYKNENDLNGGIEVYYRGCKYVTGNRYKDSVELYLDKKFAQIVKIKHVYSDGLEWVSIKEKLPDKNTRWAGKYGVSVLVYDELEAEDSGYFEPWMASFNFKEQKFEELCEGEWEEVYWVSHWMEKPLTPKDLL